MSSPLVIFKWDEDTKIAEFYFGQRQYTIEMLSFDRAQMISIALEEAIKHGRKEGLAQAVVCINELTREYKC